MTFITEVVKDTAVLAHDIEITIENSALPNKQTGHIVPEGQPGFGGAWPKYIPRTEGDSRGPCPFLNSLANHGILPHNGRNIHFTQVTQATRTFINLAETLAFFIPNLTADLLKKDYSKDTFDLEDLALHSSLSIEHDASLTRIDTGLEMDQSRPNLDLVKLVLDSATGKDEEEHAILTLADLAGCITRRRAESQKTNPKYTLSQYHEILQSLESALLLTIFGGRVDAITALLTEERLLEGWETKVTEQKGLTITEFSKIALQVKLAAAGEHLKQPK